MRGIETDTITFISKLDGIREIIDMNPSDFTFHTLFQNSNNKLKIEIERAGQRQLIYVFYHRQQNFFKSMERDIDLVELKLLFELIKKSFGEAELVRNAHITSEDELYYFIHHAEN